MKSVVVIALILLSAIAVEAQPGLVDSLSRIVAANKRDTTQVIAYNKLGVEFGRKDLVRQRQYLYEGMTLSRKLSDFRITGFYALLTASHQAAGNPDSASYYLGLLEAAARKNPNDAIAYENFQQSAGLFYKNAGKPKLAIPYLERTLAFTKDSTNRAGMMLNIGNVYNELSDLQMATKYHLNSLTLFEKVGNKRGQSFALTSLGNDYLKMQQWNRANVYYERSLKMKEELKDTRGVLTALGGLGNVYMELGDYKSAQAAFERCYNMAREMSITVETGRALNELAQVHRRMGHMEKAKGYYNEALVIANQQGDQAWVANLEAQLLQLDSEGKSASQVEAGLIKTLNQYKEYGDRIGVANAHHNLSEFYSKQKDYTRPMSI